MNLLQYNWYETLPPQGEHELSIASYYLVFSWKTILLLIFADYVFRSIPVIRHILLPRREEGILPNLCYGAARVLFLMFCTLVAFYYGAKFRGDTFALGNSILTSLTKLEGFWIRRVVEWLRYFETGNEENEPTNAFRPFT
ncbi:hypothetical protein PRIPAC_74995 [Pristionchus pacificus]|uniref:Uncharacterized protein n=1 Tax=Pristionchus pacificus TaxID=54126 RepID=A0A2A6C836_PRIPA|nr:hypothetical protein PRIPAC_74995 [Pristionchus pacificus]|eukprot:PDM74191.1 hypothetical protein PRIPAC_41547 [Pristionchus pacificus]